MDHFRSYHSLMLIFIIHPTPHKIRKLQAGFQKTLKLPELFCIFPLQSISRHYSNDAKSVVIHSWISEKVVFFSGQITLVDKILLFFFVFWWNILFLSVYNISPVNRQLLVLYQIAVWIQAVLKVSTSMGNKLRWKRLLFCIAPVKQ